MAQLSEQGRIAANRFGMGLRPDQMDALAADPLGWLKRQIDAPYRAPAGMEKLPQTQSMMGEMRSLDKGDEAAKRKMRRELRQKLAKAGHARLQHAIMTEDSFIERLAFFWLNHFSVSRKNAGQAATLTDYELEAIRPHITGHFADMLLAVAQHPAMLIYLDNAASFSPDSRMGKRRKKGLNENLAREILELHTLGVNGGYTQADVGALARLITGWSINREKGTFQFRGYTHDPAEATLLGTRYPAGKNAKDKQTRGEKALRDIAQRPETARFLATKLARHFIADTPPPQVVEHLAAAYTNSKGDLKAVYHALIALPEAWVAQPAKLKSSTELIISAARLANAGTNLNPKYFHQSYQELGSAPFTADSPAGFPDTAAELLGSDMVIRRIGWAPYAARLLVNENSIAPDSAAHRAFGEQLSPTTYKTITSTEEREQAYAYLFASPEFQRR